MCGIIGKISVNNVVPQLLNGLKKLEYRGYDSSGIAVFDNGNIKSCKASGKIEMLEKELESERLSSFGGIAHTRWATHGKPTKENAHPHFSPTGMFAVVHNGIIENVAEVKKTLLPENSCFVSETDTEVFTHLLDKYYKGEPVSAIANACAVLKGSYAFGILCKDYPGVIFGAASASPLVVVKCKDGNYITSDAGAIGEISEAIYRMGHGEICSIDSDTLTFYDASGKQISKHSEKIISGGQDFHKSGFEHYMLKEIFEQPDAVKRTVQSLLSGDTINLPDISLSDEYFKENIEKIALVACGSAYHAGLVGKYVLERMCKIPCTAEIASEFRYSSPLIDENTLAIFISQSGETADTLASLRLASKKGAQIISVVNVPGSIIAEESDNVIYTIAGKEVAVATTKAYSAQLCALYALGIYIGNIRGTISDERQEKLIRELKALPQKIQETIEETEEPIKLLSQEIYKSTDMFYIGRLLDYATACEGSLKIKEISYINSQVYAAGELKHGTISLIEADTPVISILGESKIFYKTLSNISEVEARGGKPIVITTRENEKIVASKYKTVAVSDTMDEFICSLLVLPLQLLGYHTAKLRECDIDKPRNLAKSVTVE